MVPAIRLEGFHRSTLTALACFAAPIMFSEFGAIRKINDASHQTRRVSQLSTGRTDAPCCSQYLKCRNVIDDVDKLGDDDAPSVTTIIAGGMMPPVSLL